MAASSALLVPSTVTIGPYQIQESNMPDSNRPPLNRFRLPNEPDRTHAGTPLGKLSSWHIIELDPLAQSERSPDDGIAALVAEVAGGLVRDAALAPELPDIFADPDERDEYLDLLDRVEEAHSLVVAWSGDVPLECPRAAVGLACFRLSLEAHRFDVVGFAATMHDNLGYPSLHGASWAMVLRGPSVTVVRELMRRAWHEATVAVRPHKCGWCSKPAGGMGTIVI